MMRLPSRRIRLDDARRLTLAIGGCLSFALVLAVVVWVGVGHLAATATRLHERATAWETQRQRAEVVAALEPLVGDDPAGAADATDPGGVSAADLALLTAIDELEAGFAVPELAGEPAAEEFAGRVRALAAGGATVDTWEALAADVAVVATDAGEAVPGAVGLLVVRFRIGAVVSSIVFVVAVRALIFPLIGSIARTGRHLSAARAEQQAQSRRRELASRVADGLDAVESETAARDVVARALDRIATRPVEVLLADSSRAHLEQAVSHPRLGAPGCGVSAPWSCPAVRRGRTAIYARSDDLDACPHLDERPGGPCSAVCIPLTFLGDALGVMHLAGEPGDLPGDDEIAALELVASETAVRLGTMRKIARIELQARLDPVTGLPNIRATREYLAGVLAEPDGVLVALVAIDGFAGFVATGDAAVDRALRLVAAAAEKATFDGFAGRLRGGQAVLVWRGLAESLARARCRTLVGEVAMSSARTGCTVPVSWSVGRAAGHADVDALLEALRRRLGPATAGDADSPAGVVGGDHPAYR